ncbi:NAD/FAD-utilizing enzyme [Ferrimonas balearica]|uniref:NAD/FAD-utilizing enzyme n=1 Tax=Ferrimonas balearica TaxID=44012 RepID=UPI001C99E56E|nr:NAD/FAD-utilizing enzyme [Ferrimonas balearica]MBY5991751.1 NAD/FAD-utilizing enzyme [Ferrimonas balearica]
MTRHYYLSNSLWELELIERQLEKQGLSPAQIHVHSRHPALVSRFHLLPVSSLMLYDLLYYAWRGLQLGAGLAMAILGFFLWLGVGSLGWVPIWMFAALVLGFCTWEGGLIGLQSPHHRIERFEEAIAHGMHLMMVDVEPAQEDSLAQVMVKHPAVFDQGTRRGASRQQVAFQDRWLHWRGHPRR